MWRVAVLHHGSPSSLALAELREGFHRRGLIHGVNCVVDAAGVEGQWERLPMLVEQLLQRGPDVMVAMGALAALSAQRATSRVPILHAIVLDASDIGLAARNVIGVSTFDPDQATRHLGLLQQLVPGLRKVAFLTDVDVPRGTDGLNPLVSRLMRAAVVHRLDATCVALSGIDANLNDAFNSVLRGRTLRQYWHLRYRLCWRVSATSSVWLNVTACRRCLRLVGRTPAWSCRARHCTTQSTPLRSMLPPCSAAPA